MSSRPKAKRSYNKAPCNACYSPEEIGENHEQFGDPLDKSHLETTKHKFITTVTKDQVDLSKIKPQNNQSQSDEYYVQREEHKRMSKLNNKKPWLDVRFCKKNQDYVHYCNYCDDFILGVTLSKHEQLDKHWKKFQKRFMTDLSHLLSKSSTKLDHSVFEFTQKYTGIELEDAKAFYRSHSNQIRIKGIKDDAVNELNDSGIEISIANNNKSIGDDQSNLLMVTSTPKKSAPKIVSPKKVPKKTSNAKNVEAKTAYVKDMHTSTEVCKTAYTDTVRMYYQNVNSIKSDEKMKNFVATSVSKYDVVIFTETWLNDAQALKHNMSGFNEHFDVYRRNRSESVKSRGGGVLVAVSAKLYSDPVLLNRFNHLEYVCLQFLNNNKSIFLYCAYIPPDSTIDIYADHVKAIRSINLRKDDLLIVVGDFNLPNFDWHTKDNKTFWPEMNGSVRETRLQTQKFQLLKELQLKCKLYQFCNAKNHKGNVLDLVFSNYTDHMSIGELPESQKPMSKHDERHAPPFEIIINCEHFSTKKDSKSHILD
ncbi:uncharacterized protein LOC129565513 [Sitodiplosis mosellana]|uniref:uncharacterized protein LOC129565513 n=1 Tax=Sitodiplosis mosellana TaxID=263140 RepID=UPI00244397B8|nr:uncharacterized protein LOC129565513 [Sitodiplosis mosellana]